MAGTTIGTAVQSATAAASKVASQTAAAVNQAASQLPTTLGGLTANLSGNTWTSSAKDALAVKDVYTGVDGKSVLTSVQNLFSDIGLNLSDVLRGGKWVAAQIPLITSLVKQGEAVLSQKGLVARVMSASGLATGALSRLTAGATDGILGEIKDFGQVYASFNGVLQRVASTDLTNMNAVGGLINSWTGQNGLFASDDQDGKVGFITGLIHDCTSYGIPNSFGSLVSQLENTNLVSQVTNRVLPSVIGASDISSLKSMAFTLGDKAITALNPNAVSHFSSAFSMPPLSTATDNSAKFDELIDAYSTVDSTWNTNVRNTANGSVSTLNLTSVMNGSDDFNVVLNQGSMSAPPPTDPAQVNPQLYQLATKLSTPDPVSTLMQQFPATLYQPNTIAAQPSTDADTIGANPSLAAASANPTSQQHILLGHSQGGTPVYSDDQYRAGMMIDITPQGKAYIDSKIAAGQPW
jgi:hypothetical protein